MSEVKRLTRFGMRHAALLSASLSLGAQPTTPPALPVDTTRQDANAFMAQVAEHGWATLISAEDLSSAMADMSGGLVMYAAEQRAVPVTDLGLLVGCEVHLSTSQVYAGHLPGICRAP